MAAAGAMAEKLGAAYKAIEHIDYTQKANRDIEYRFSRGDIAVFAMPVYAGRIPNIILPALKANVIGNATYAVPICVYGNRRRAKGAYTAFGAERVFAHIGRGNGQRARLQR